MRVDRKGVATRIRAWSKKEIDPGDRQHFAEIVEAELIGRGTEWVANHYILGSSRARVIDRSLFSAGHSE
jgi:hypothetical protein